MIRSSKSQLLNAEKEAANGYYIGKEIDQMIRNQMLMQGLTPPILFEEEKPRIEQERESIMTLLKTITTQPNKFYTYLYNTNQISLFSIGMEEFARKYLKYRKNIPYNELISAWNDFKENANSRIGSLSNIIERDKLSITEQERRRNLEDEERQGVRDIYLTEAERMKKNIENQQNVGRSRNINTPAKKERDAIIKALNKRAREEFEKAQREEYIAKQQEYYNKYSKLIQLRDSIAKENNTPALNILLETAKEQLGLSSPEELSSGEGVRRTTGSGLKNHKKVKLLRINNNRVIYPIGHIWNWM